MKAASLPCAKYWNKTPMMHSRVMRWAWSTPGQVIRKPLSPNSDNCWRFIPTTPTATSWLHRPSTAPAGSARPATCYARASSRRNDRTTVMRSRRWKPCWTTSRPASRISSPGLPGGVISARGPRLSDNCPDMLQWFQLRGGARSSRCAWHATATGVILLVLLLALVRISYAQQAASSAASGKTPANPLTMLLKDKPKVPEVAPELPAPTPEQPAAIPLPEVAARSQDLARALREYAAKLPTPEQIDKIKGAVNEIEPSLQTKLEEVNNLLAGSPNSLELREEETFWHGIDSFTTEWRQQLLTWAKSAQDTMKMLDKEEPVWSATLEENKNNEELGPVLTVLQDNLAEIRGLRKQEQDALQLAVNLQIKVARLDAMANDAIARLEATRKQLKGHLLDRDSLP